MSSLAIPKRKPRLSCPTLSFPIPHLYLPLKYCRQKVLQLLGCFHFPFTLLLLAQIVPCVRISFLHISSNRSLLIVSRDKKSMSQLKAALVMTTKTLVRTSRGQNCRKALMNTLEYSAGSKKTICMMQGPYDDTETIVYNMEWSSRSIIHPPPPKPQGHWLITGGPQLCAERTFGGHGTCGIFLKHNGRSLNKSWQRDRACEIRQNSTKTTKVPWHGPSSNNSIGNMTV